MPTHEKHKSDAKANLNLCAWLGHTGGRCSATMKV